MRIETIALPMDALCIAVLSMSRMGCVQQLDLGSSLVEVFTSKLTSGQWRVARSNLLHYFFMIQESRAEQSTMTT